MDYNTYELFRDDLIKDEQILWHGQPETKVIFSRADVFLVPFSLLWVGFVIFWELDALGFVWGSAAPLFFALFGVPLVVIGLYFMFGRFIFKMRKKRNTYYAVTNKRVLILTKKRSSKTFQAEYISSIPSVNKSIRSDGIGTITFGNPSFMGSMYGNTGMDFFASFFGKDVPTFHDIKDAEQVYRVVNDLRNK